MKRFLRNCMTQFVTDTSISGNEINKNAILKDGICYLMRITSEFLSCSLIYTSDKQFLSMKFKGNPTKSYRIQDVSVITASIGVMILKTSGIYKDSWYTKIRVRSYNQRCYQLSFTFSTLQSAI